MEHLLKCHEIAKTDFQRGEGCFLYDDSGRRYTDFEAGIWCTALGHNHPQIQKAITDQVGKLVHLGTRYPSRLAEEAAQALLDVCGISQGKCIFLSSGSEAVEFGVQAARLCCGRALMLTFPNTYLAAYGFAGQKQGQEWVYFDWRACEGCPSRDDCDPGCPSFDSLPFESLAAFVFDGGNASGQVRLPPVGVVRELSRRVRETGGLVVANEITSGMGRTGAWFGYQHYGLQPDIITVGKGLGNGYPVSAVVLRLETAVELEGSGLRYAQSHQNDPLGCAVAIEVLAVMQAEALVERSRRVGELFKRELDRLCQRQRVLKQVRGRGLMIALEFEAAAPDPAAVNRQLLENGFLVGCTPAANLLRFYPALVIGEGEIRELVASLDEILAEPGERSIVT
jgi:acetylornithine/N-succinyldiaminopimelate aminotransferase